MSDSKLTDEMIPSINREHLLTTELEPADLLFVFGTRDGVAERIEAAARLWRAGYAHHLIVSGGMTSGDSRTECAVIKGGIVARGVPSQLVMEEHQATNTGENVIFSLPVIEATHGLRAIRSVICLGNLWTARRYPMTLHRHWPEPKKMLVVVNHYSTPDARWHENVELRNRVLGEYAKIEPYKALGFIADWP